MEEKDIEAIDEMDVSVLYICSYGQTGVPICVDLGHEYCKLPNQQDKECDLRPVVSYRDYKQLKEQLKRKEKELSKYKQALQNIKREIYTCDRCQEECLNSDCDECEYDYIEKIKNIINEVEE